MAVTITLTDDSKRTIEDSPEGKVVAEYREPLDLLIISRHPHGGGEATVIEQFRGHQYRGFKNH